MTLKAKKLHPNAKLPIKAHPDDACFDLFAVEDEIVWKGSICQIQTGIAIAIPPGYFGLILEKSGLAIKHGIQIHGGVIDSNYRGEIIVLVSLHSHNKHEEFMLSIGDKIAQLAIVPIHAAKDFIEVAELNNTDRGENGFGSTVA